MLAPDGILRSIGADAIVSLCVGSGKSVTVTDLESVCMQLEQQPGTDLV
jgi:DNA-binding Xre family transcriptional regulator